MTTCLRVIFFRDRNLQVSLHLNEFLVNYWVSHTRHSGVEVHGRRLALLCGPQMNLVPPDDTAGLIVSTTSHLVLLLPGGFRLVVTAISRLVDCCCCCCCCQRRVRSVWSVRQLGVEQRDVTVWLCSSNHSQVRHAHVHYLVSRVSPVVITRARHSNICCCKLELRDSSD